jgi:hypothetical protein
LPEDTRVQIRAGLQEQFEFLFNRLAVTDTQEMVARYVSVPEQHRAGPSALRIKAAADDWDLSD